MMNGESETRSGPEAMAVLEHARTLLGLSLRELAATLPVHESTIHRWRRGTRPSPAVSRRLGMLHDFTAVLDEAGMDGPAVEAWLDAPASTIDGRHPRTLLLEGQFDVLRRILAGSTGGAPDGRPADGHIDAERDRLLADLRAERAAAHASARWSRFFARSTEALVEAIGFDDTLARVGTLMVPALADFCEILLLRSHGRALPGGGTRAADVAAGERVSGQLESASIASVDPALVQALDALDHRACAPLDESSPLDRVVVSGEAVLYTDLADLTRRPGPCERLGRLHEAGIRSVIVAPLVARGRVLGALVCGQTGREQRFTRADSDLAQEFARIAAIAIDNALLLQEAERARMAAESADRAKSDFLSTMSHELRTPLNAILGFASLLADGVPSPIAEEQRHPVERIIGSARHLLAMIEELLEFARLETTTNQPAEIMATEVDVLQVARETAGMVEPAATLQGLALDLELPDTPLTVITDARRLRQILLNLLNNAVRYTDSGSVLLRAEPLDEGGARIEVRDTGIGIAPEHLEKVFEPFWQVDQSKTRKVGGTGLGLSISRHLANLLGAWIEVSSTPRVGSVFTLTLPPQPPPPRLD
jgi:signal transduction histidine kinase/transcriptional regulator with XRE-family HTH domain